MGALQLAVDLNGHGHPPIPAVPLLSTIKDVAAHISPDGGEWSAQQDIDVCFGHGLGESSLVIMISYVAPSH